METYGMCPPKDRRIHTDMMGKQKEGEYPYFAGADFESSPLSNLSEIIQAVCGYAKS